jgi:hypothetical protein
MKPTSLKALTKDEKLALLSELEEKEKRLKRRRDLYKPNELQAKVHQSQKRIRFVAAGNGSGKTALGVQESYWAATGTHPSRPNLPVPNTGVVLLDSPDKVKRWLEEYDKFFDTTEWQFNKHGKPYICEIVLPNGSGIEFMFHLQEDLQFESKELDWLIADEPPPRKPYIGLQRGLRRVSGAWTLIVGTPLAQPWLKQEIWDKWAKGERDDIECFKAGILVNAANLGKDYIANFSKDLTEHEKRVRLHGEFSHLEGLALADLFIPEHHVIERFDWPRGWPVVVAIDFHGAKKTTALMLGVNKLDEFYAIKTFSSASPPSKFAEEIKDWYKGYRVQDVLCDSLGASPRTGGYENFSFIDVLRQNGVPVRSTSFKEKSNDAWIQNIRDLLRLRETKLGKRPSLYVFNDLLQLINEFESVLWAKNKATGERLPYLDISNQDLLSCLKYALAAPPMLGRIGRIITRQKPSYASPTV